MDQHERPRVVDVSGGGRYDLFVIGSGPAGQRAAIQAAKLGRRVGLAEMQGALGGVCINTGTIPSKTLRQAVIELSSASQREDGGSLAARSVDMGELVARVHRVIGNEQEVARRQLTRNGVELHWARASLAGPHRVRLEQAVGGDGSVQEVTADYVMVATGTTATRDPHIPFDGHRVLTSDEVLELDRVPRTLAVVGAGVIGAEYASIFAALGVRVVLIDKRRELLPFLDDEIVAALTYQLRRHRVTMRLGEEVAGVEVVNGGAEKRVRLQLASGKQIVADRVLYSIGRSGATAGLGLEAIGIEPDDRGRLAVDEHYRTAVPHIYAAGDVIGFPALAATSMEQGRLAAAHAFGGSLESEPGLFPYGVYTVPEISMVGRTEVELTEAGVPYEVGTAHYREIARGQIVGDLSGLMKLVVHLETHEVLGVHIIGEGASELVHIGQAVMALGGTVEYFVKTVFNYPTFAECYKTAAFDALNRMAEVEGFDLQLPDAVAESA
jgi:NAD(P) transhydrogenase